MIFFNKICNRFLILLIGISLISSCDEVESDVMPTADEINAAQDSEVTLTNGPVIVDLLQNTTVSANATISIKQKPEKGNIQILESALIQYTPNDAFKNGSDFATYTVCVGNDCDEGKLTFEYKSEQDVCTIKAENDYVTVEMPSGQVTIEVLKNDQACQEGFDVATLTIIEDVSHGKTVATDGLVVYEPEEGFAGSVSFIYGIATHTDPERLKYGLVEVEFVAEGVHELKAHDDTFEFTYHDYLLEMSEFNNSLVFMVPEVIGNDSLEQQPLEALTIDVIATPTYGTATYYENAQFLYTPGAEFAGDDRFIYQVCIGERCSQAEIIISVPDFPTLATPLTAGADSFAYTMEEYQAGLEPYGDEKRLTFSLSSIFRNDEIGQLNYWDLEVEIISQATAGTATYHTNEFFSYTPNADFQGEDSFVYKICANGICSQATVAITVSDYTDHSNTISAVDDSFLYTMEEYLEKLETYGDEQRLTFSLSSIFGNDEIWQLNYWDLEVEIITPPSMGEVVYYTNEFFSYTPGDEFQRGDSFVYKICANGDCSEATVSIVIDDWN